MIKNGIIKEFLPFYISILCSDCRGAYPKRLILSMLNQVFCKLVNTA